MQRYYNYSMSANNFLKYRYLGKSRNDFGKSRKDIGLLRKKPGKKLGNLLTIGSIFSLLGIDKRVAYPCVP